MAHLGEPGWQTGQKIVECNRYMLDNEIATDVCFEVGPPGGATVNIRAHRYMLISRSPVFEAMFRSGMTECSSSSEAKIRVEDIEASIFKEVLNFVYCDVADVTFDSCHALLSAADKYMMTGLVRICSKLIEENMDETNVCSVLDLSCFYGDSSLKDKCLTFIAENSETFFRRREYRSLSRGALEAIVRLDRITSRESTVYLSCIAWAEYQLMQQGIEHPDDEQIRETLGSILHEIRFPTMDASEFDELVGTADILTEDEKTLVYDYMDTEDRSGKLPFNARDRQEFVVSRFSIVHQAPWGSECESCKSGPRSLDAIEFETDANITLTGLGLFTGKNECGVEIEIGRRHGVPKNRKQIIIPPKGKSKVFPVRLDKPIHIRKGDIWVISTSTRGTIDYYGSNTFSRGVLASEGSKVFMVTSKEANVTFAFQKHSASSCALGTNCTTEWKGQIPRLYFMVKA